MATVEPKTKAKKAKKAAPVTNGTAEGDDLKKPAEARREREPTPDPKDLTGKKTMEAKKAADAKKKGEKKEEKKADSGATAKATEEKEVEKEKKNALQDLGEVLADDEFELALDSFANHASSDDVGELLKTMNESNIISWEEAETLMGESSSGSKIAKCGLPQAVRPSEPENRTDVEDCLQRMHANDPTMSEIVLNNMKRTPIIQIQKIFEAMKTNEGLTKLALANTGLTDGAAEPLLEALEVNSSLTYINLETNYLSGEFLAKMFKALLKQQSVEEVHAVNQGATFSTQAELDITEAIEQSNRLIKVGLSFRKHECRIRVDQKLLRNNEIRRLLRRQQANLEEAEK